MLERECKSCKQIYPKTSDFFYKNSGCRDGLLPRCKGCVDTINKKNFQKRMALHPEKTRMQSNLRSKKFYHNNIEKSRKISRDSARKRRKDPEQRIIINMRKRAGGLGLTPEEFYKILDDQENKCAICKVTEKDESKWNVDHCHKTNKFRFILCNHCNRGLGAFKDNTKNMRIAADLLDAFYGEDIK